MEGALLLTTALCWVLALVGPALTELQQMGSRWAFGKSIALPVDVPVALWWVWLVGRRPSAVTT